MLHVQAAVLCDKAASLSTPFTFLPLLWEKSASANGAYGRQSDEILVYLKFLNFSIDRIIRISWHLTKVQCYYSVTKAFQLVFWVKYIVGHVMEACKSGMPRFFVSIPTIIYIIYTYVTEFWKIDHIVRLA